MSAWNRRRFLETTAVGLAALPSARALAAAADDDPLGVRSDFPITRETAYLNTASVGPLSQRTRDALVADYPGLTRDRLYGYCKTAAGPAVIIDTGGLSGEQDPMSVLMARQVELAVDEADVVIFLVEATSGLTPGDTAIAESLRKTGKPIVLAVNKAEGLPAEETAAEFWALGVGEPQVPREGPGGRAREAAGVHQVGLDVDHRGSGGIVEAVGRRLVGSLRVGGHGEEAATGLGVEGPQGGGGGRAARGVDPGVDPLGGAQGL